MTHDDEPESGEASHKYRSSFSQSQSVQLHERLGSKELEENVKAWRAVQEDDHCQEAAYASRNSAREDSAGGNQTMGADG